MAVIADLTGETISSSYGTLLMVTNTAGISGSIQTVQDGLGANDSALKLSTTVVGVNGSLGVGLDSPEYVIHAQTADDYVGKFESTDAGASIILEDNGSTTDGNRITVTSDALSVATANVTALTIDSSQNVGIGVTPSQTLHTYDSTNSERGVLVENDGASTSTSALLRLTTGTDTAALIRFASEHASRADQLFMTQAGDNPIHFATQDTDRMIITGSGNVGIGTDAPSTLFHCAGNGTFSHGSSNLQVDFTANNSTILNFTNGTSEGTVLRTDEYFRFDTGGSSERMRIDSSGNVGIGGTPSFKLEVVADAANWATQIQNDHADGYGLLLTAGKADGTTDALLVENVASTALLTVKGDGNVGIGGTAENKLHVICDDDDGIRISAGTAAAHGDKNARILAINSEGTYWNDLELRASETRIYSDGTAALTIDSSGNVGIGIVPAAPLTVQGADAGTIAIFNGSTGTTTRGLKLSLATDGVTNNVVNFDAQHSAGILVFQTGGTPAMSIDSSQRVIIPNIPTSDPAIAGALWSDSGTVKISAG